MQQTHHQPQQHQQQQAPMHFSQGQQIMSASPIPAYQLQQSRHPQFTANTSIPVTASVVPGVPSAVIVDTQSHKSVIDCGYVDSTTNERILKEYVKFFDTEVEVFTAASDAEASSGGKPRLLFKASSLAHMLNCPTNKLAMYLARRRDKTDGIFQATVVRHKPEQCMGLKTGSYLISLEVCKTFEKYYRRRTGTPSPSSTPETAPSKKVPTLSTVSEEGDVEKKDKSEAGSPAAPLSDPESAAAVAASALKDMDGSDVAVQEKESVKDETKTKMEVETKEIKLDGKRKALSPSSSPSTDVATEENMEKKETDEPSPVKRIKAEE